jgi:hypothetical protein
MIVRDQGEDASFSRPDFIKNILAGHILLSPQVLETLRSQ